VACRPYQLVAVGVDCQGDQVLVVGPAAGQVCSEQGYGVVVSVQGVHVHQIDGVAGELVVCVLADVGQELDVSEVRNCGQVLCEHVDGLLESGQLGGLLES
jgi:hypothetical protein